MPTPQSLQPLALRLADFTRVTGLSRSKAYELIGEGKLHAIKVGGRRLIPYAEAERLISGAGARAGCRSAKPVEPDREG